MTTDTRSHHQYLHAVADVDAPNPERVVAMVAEMRALELLRALRNLVNGTPHALLEAKNVLILVDGGVPPRNPHTPHEHNEAA
jgi:hypothetical protein